MERTDRGFTLVELMIVVTIIAIIASIAIPSVLRSRMSANHSNAGAALKTLVTQETIWRSLDIDKNGCADYWVRDLRAMYAAKAGAGSYVKLIDVAFANADMSAPALYGYSGEAPLTGTAKHDYLYGSIAGNRVGNSVVGADASTGLDTTPTNMHTSLYGFTAVPATYNTGCVLQFIVNQDGVIWQKDVGTGTPVAAYPAAPNSASPPWAQFGG
jgi:prepilin-type N-terminal cleavage/methylation domain-containing protein